MEQVTKCVWFLRRDEEEMYYEPFAMNLAGEGIDLTVGKSYADFKQRTDFILSQYEEEKMSFDEFDFEALEMIVCRYYGYIPRVNVDFLT